MKKLALIFFLTAVLVLRHVPAFSQVGSDYMYLELTDLAHGKSLVAGERYDRKVYHQESKNRDVASWKFIPAQDDYYYIVDRRHQKMLSLSPFDENLLHHGFNNDSTNSMWKLVDMGDGKTFQIIDAKNGKALVAGNRYNGHVYHQEPGDRTNAIWRLAPRAGDGEAPKEFVVSEEYETTIYHFDQKQIIGEPKRIIIQDHIKNTSDDDIEESFDAKREIAVTESWKLSKSVSHKIMSSITASVQYSGPAVKAKISTTLETESEKKETKTKSGSKEVKYEVSFTTEQTVGPDEQITCCRIIEYSTANIPITAKIMRTYGDGHTELVDYSGTYRGTNFSTSEIHCGPESEPCDRAPLTSEKGGY